jgi:hypothetical protein
MSAAGPSGPPSGLARSRLSGGGLTGPPASEPPRRDALFPRRELQSGADSRVRRSRSDPNFRALTFGGDCSPPGGSVVSATTTLLTAATTSLLLGAPPVNHSRVSAAAPAASRLSAMPPLEESRPSPPKAEIPSDFLGYGRGSAADVPYALSAVSSCASKWGQHYWDKPSVAFERGLRPRDVHFCIEDSICKAAVKDMDIPAYPKSQGEATKNISIASIDKQLKRLGADPETGRTVAEPPRKFPPSCAAIATKRYHTWSLQKTNTKEEELAERQRDVREGKHDGSLVPVNAWRTHYAQ